MHAARVRSIVILTVLSLVVSLVPAGALAAPPAGKGQPTPKAVFFASDGMRQDLVAKYAAEGVMPTMASFLKNGISATGNGLLTEAPPNTGAGWHSLATGAWPSVTGSTNNTFHVNGQPFGNRTGSFDAGVLQAETLAQAAERGGLKVAQVEWAGGRNATTSGPTIDYRSFLSGRGVATNYIGTAGDVHFDDAAFIAAFGLQFDHPAGYAGQAPYPGADPVDASGWTDVPMSYSPAKEMRLRVLDFGTDKYGLNAYIYDSTNDGTVNYDFVLFSTSEDGDDAVAEPMGEGEWADVKVSIVGGSLAGKTAGMLVKVETLSPDLEQVRLFHTSAARAIASWPTWAGEAGYTDFAEYLAAEFPSSTAADYAVLEAGVVSEETYVEQGLYWSTSTWPMLQYVVNEYQPDLLLAGMPTTDEFQHQFLGLVTPTLPGGDPNPAYDDVDLDGNPDGRVAEREGFLREAYAESDRTLALARGLMGANPTTFVAADHGFGAQFLAIDASLPLVEMGLLSKPQTSNCRPASGETIGKAKACWAGGTLQVYLNVAGRDPASAFQQVAVADVAATVDAIKAKYLGLVDPNDWTHDGQPEGWTMIQAAYTKAESRYIPNGPGSTADMAHPTRTGDAVIFAAPPYQFDAETPGTLVAFSHFFGQHGYLPSTQDLAANVNMRAIFLAGGTGIAKGSVSARTIDLAPTMAFILGVPQPQHAQGRVLTEVLKGGARYKAISIVGLTDFHGQLAPSSMAVDGIQTSMGGAAYLATMFDEEFATLPGPGLLLASGDNVGASPPNSALLEDMPAIDAENAWGMDATAYGNHEFDYGLERLLAQQERADFPFLATNIVETATGELPDWVTPSKVFMINGVPVGVIGADVKNTPELVSAGNTAGLTFLDEAPRIAAESNRLKALGVNVQVVVIHQGTSLGANPIGMTPGAAWQGPVIDIADALQGTTVDAMLVGHTHRISNLMRGHILVAQGYNGGMSYSVLQLMVQGGDVAWAGGATRVAKNLGVAARADVQAIIADANAQTAVLRNKVIGTMSDDPILRDPDRLRESEMGNLVADAMRDKYPGVDAAFLNSGGLRADLFYTPPSAAEQPGEVTWGEVFAILPFGNRTTILTLTGAQLESAFLNGLSPSCNPAVHTGRTPQLSGLKVQFHCSGTTPVIDGMWKTPDGAGGVEIPIAAGDSVRIVTIDFMYTGGDGYTMLAAGTNVLQPGDDLVDVVISYIAANSPVSSVVDGRTIGP